MKALTVIAALLLLLWLLGRIRVGGRVDYTEDGLTVRLCLGRFWKTVYPAPPKGEKPKKRKGRKPEPQPGERSERKGGAVGPLLELFPVAAEAAGALLRRIRVDLLAVHLCWADPDPARTAVGYGAANAAAGLICSLFEHHFRVKERDIRIDADFTAAQPTVLVRAALTLTVSQLIGLTVRYGLRVLKIRSARKSTTPETEKKKEAAAHE